jgi:hypothetical protein
VTIIFHIRTILYGLYFISTFLVLKINRTRLIDKEIYVT